MAFRTRPLFREQLRACPRGMPDRAYCDRHAFRRQQRPARRLPWTRLTLSILRQSAWAAAAAVFFTASRFAFTAIIARRLSVSEFGQYAYGQWLADLAFLLCSLGATGTIARYIA